ncbi:MAG: tetratricopeptide repeat protein [Collinsella sp.]|nr:tetratricopeptide repeat protein [Collinsella sp.]
MGAFDLKAFYAQVDGLYRDGHGDEVHRHLADSLVAARRSGDPLAIVAIASELGGVERVRGDLRQAEALYDEALLVHGRMPSPDAASSANLLINKGDVLVAQGRHAAAVNLFDRAEALLGDGAKTAFQRSAICNNRGAAYREMGEYALARRELRRAASLLDLADGADDKRAVILVSLAQILVKEGRLDEARREIDAALRLYETLSGGRDIHRPNAYACSGQIAYLEGDYRFAADQMHRAAEALRDKVGASPMVERLQEECRRMQRLADE